VGPYFYGMAGPHVADVETDCNMESSWGYIE